MGGKKRNSFPEKETVAEADTSAGNDSHKKPLKKKPKKEDEEPEIARASSVKPMERKKKRKAFDKERRRTASQPQSSFQPIPTSTPEASSGALPGFHVGVFNDLAAADESTREAAAKKLVMELQEVQNAYDGIGIEKKKEMVGDAEKDHGLDNCAPSVRYALRRLILGVSSSRECARQGFALGLGVLVVTIRNIRVESFFKLVDLLDVSSSMKGQVDHSFVVIIIFGSYLCLVGTTSTIYIPYENAGSKRLSFGPLICLWCSGLIGKTYTGIESG